MFASSTWWDTGWTTTGLSAGSSLLQHSWWWVSIKSLWMSRVWFWFFSSSCSRSTLWSMSPSRWATTSILSGGRFLASWSPSPPCSGFLVRRVHVSVNLVYLKQISNLQLIICSGYAIYYFFTTRGTWREVLAAGVTPVIKARPEALLAEIKYNEARAGERKDVELSLLDPPTTEAVPGRDGSTLLSQEEDEDQRSSRCGSTSCVEEEPPAYPAVL